MRKRSSKFVRKRRRRFQIEALESRRLLAADLDYGDAPDLGPGNGPGDYSTLPGDNGPSHIVSPALFMGTQPDGEVDPQPTNTADGDDYGGIRDDEDGLRSPGLDLSFTVTSSPTVTVLVTNTLGNGKAATLYGWIDFNGDGVFDDANERASAEVVSPPTDDNPEPSPDDGFFVNQAIELQFPQLLTSFYGKTYARFRLGLSEDDAAAISTGSAGVGEVEDYVAQIYRPSTAIAEELQYYQAEAIDDFNSGQYYRPFVSQFGSHNHQFGSSMVAIGDLDKNDVVDLAVAVPGASMGGVENGAVHVFFMEEDGSYSKRTIISPDALFGTSNDNDGRWLRLESLGDLDKDGINELAVSYGDDRPISLHAMYLDFDGAARLVKPITTGVGFPVGFLGDIDNNGSVELAVKNPYNEGRESLRILSLNSQADLVATSEIFNAEAGGELPDENDSFGWAVEPVGDLDNNGTIDVAVGVQNGGSFDAGQVQILFLDESDGSFSVAQRSELMQSSDDASTGFGNAISAIGDLDGDNITELVIGDPTLRARSFPDGEPTSSVEGAASVVFLDSDGTVKGFGPYPLKNTSQLSNSEYYGTSIEFLGDLSGDGTIEVAIGAPGYENTGSVEIVSLNPQGERTGESEIGPFGTRGQSSSVVTSLGDIDGNGYQDMAVSEGNAIQILLVGAEGQVIATEEISESTSGIGNFGTVGSLASAGDIDGDGIQELAVGTTSFSDISRFSDYANGVVRMLYLNSDGSLRDFSEVHPSPNIGPDEDNYDPAYLNFGKAITSPGDLDGNGVPDLLVLQDGFTRSRRIQGSETTFTTDTYPGVINVLLMQRNGSVLRGEKIEVTGGSDLTAIGDINGDGYPDVVLGAPTTLDVLFLGENGAFRDSKPYSFPESEDSKRLGASVSYVGDLDADGVPDLLVGGTRTNEIGTTEIVLLHSDGTVKNRVNPELPLSFAYRGQGLAFAPLGDVDGDGVVDFAMASPPRNRDYVPDGGLFVIGLEEKRLGDFGDAPDSGIGTGVFDYETDPSDNGPVHFVDQRLRLGQLVTNDTKVTSDVEANQDDDDGIVNPIDLHLTGDSVIDLSVTNETLQDAKLYGWIDSNFDGVFDASERVSKDIAAGTTNQIVSLSFTDLPAGVSGTTYARFRLSTDSAAAMPTGLALDGEVEDYRVTIRTDGVIGVRDVKDYAQDLFVGSSLIVERIGDINGDGFDDYLTEKEILFADADERIIGSRDFAWGGWSTGIGDINGDGVPDIATAEWNLAEYPTGTIALHMLNRDGEVIETSFIADGVNGGPAISDSRSRIGADLLGIGDLNLDGHNDLIVSVTRTNDVYVLFLDQNHAVQNYVKHSGPDQGFFGSTIANLGDFDDDGVDDIVVGASSYNGYGAFYVALMNREGTFKDLTRSTLSDLGWPVGNFANRDFFGDAITAIGDVNDDGITDLAVGAHGFDFEGTNAGGVFVVTLNEQRQAQDATLIYAGPPGQRAGRTLKTLADRDDNGLPEIAHGTQDLLYLTRDILDFGDAPTVAYRTDVTVSDYIQLPADDVFDRFGGSVTDIGDVNGDEVADIAVGSFNKNKVSILMMNADGSTQSRATWSGEEDPATRDQRSYGDSIAAIGDLDNDGISELAVGAFGNDLTGAVHIVFPGADGLPKRSVKIGNQIGGGPQQEENDRFGWSVASVGDLNQDGIGDLAVGSPYERNGAVYILFLNSEGFADSSVRIGHDEGVSYSGQYFGTSVASIGDVDGDAIPDLAVGTGENGIGSVFVLMMNRDGTVRKSREIGRADIPSLGNGERFGASVTAIGDLDNDGISEIAIGAPDDNTGGSDHGAVHLVFLKPDGSVRSVSKIAASRSEESPTLINTGGNRINFGTGLSLVGDYDQDGFRDLAVGAPYAPNGGSVYTLSLNPTLYGSQDTGGEYPSHGLSSDLFLGAGVDGETRQRSDLDASLDDLRGAINDADGLVDPAQLSNLTPGEPVEVDVLVTNATGVPATLWGWIDFNGNNVFDIQERNLVDPTEAIVADETIGGVTRLTFSVPGDLVEGSTYARFRLSTDPEASEPTGPASDGEVEDYSTSLTIIDTDYGDAPDSYKTLSTNDGPSHLVSEDLYIGKGVDVELEAKVSTTARGDTDDGLVNDAEDLNLIPGQFPKVRITVTNDTEAPARLLGWIDYLGDGVFGADEEAFKEIAPEFNGMVELEFPKVPDQALGHTFARFRLSTDATLNGSIGPATDGEVEDYRVTILAYDFGDAPPGYETASHLVDGVLSIGTAVDRELSYIASSDANSDDSIGNEDDEDGVDESAVFFTPGKPPSVKVQVAKPEGVTASLYGWIDIDGDGFADDETAVQALSASSSGTFEVDLNWTNPIPEGASGLRNVRFRISTDDLTDLPGGHASDGEVEDHQILIRNIDLGDAPDPNPGTETGNYRTRLADGGPSHSVDPDLYLGGPLIDSESDSNQTFLDDEGMPVQRVSANGDDVTGIDDEDGLVDAAEDLKLIVDEIPEVRLVATNKTEQLATVHGWIDFNMDGDFVDEGEHSYKTIGRGQVNQLVTLEFDPLVTGEHLGTTYARFRITTDLALEPEMVKPTGHLSDGEVEDYVGTMSHQVNTDSLELTELRISGAEFLSGNAKANEFYGSSIASLGASGTSDVLAGVPGKAASGTFVLNVDQPEGFNDEIIVQSFNNTFSPDRLNSYSNHHQGASFGASLASITESGLFAIGAPDTGIEEGNCATTEKTWNSGSGFFGTGYYSTVCTAREWHPTHHGSVSVYGRIPSGAYGFYALNSWSDTSTTPTTNPGDRYGASIANIGQINVDTEDDVAVGAPGYGANQGAVYVLQRNGGDISSYTRISSKSSNLMPELADGAQFGISVAAFSDNVIAVGTKEQSGRGSIYLLTLNSGGQVVTSPTRIGSGTTNLGSFAKNEGFGAAVVAPGDLNGDGIDDLIVGSPGYGKLGALRILYLGPKDGDAYTIRSSEILTPAKLRKANPSMPTISSGDRFGHALSLNKSMDSEGRLEILVGAPKFGSNDSGGVFLLSLQSRLTPATLDDNILDLPDSESEVESDIGSDSIDDWLGAVASLPEFPRPNEVVKITLNVLPSTSISGKDISVPSGYELVINSNDGPLTFTGASPAFTLRSGNVTVVGDVTFVNATDAPTILVTGGRLKLRGTRIDETTTSDRPAIEVVGGTVDLGTADDPGNNIININGPGSLISNAGAEIIAAVGNAFEQDGTEITDGFILEEKISDYFEIASVGAVLVYDDRYFDQTKARVSDFDLQKLSADLGLGDHSFEILGNVAGTVTLLSDNQTVRFTADSSGRSSFTFAVIGDNETQAIRTIELDVTNNPPEVNLGGDLSGSEGDTFSFGGAYSDPDENTVHTFAWTVTDESDATVSAGTDQAFDFIPSDNGTYTVKYSVTDGLGETGSDQVVLVVDNVAPSFILADETLLPPVEGVFSRSVTFVDPGTTDEHTVKIDWDGDGTTDETFVLPVGTRTFELDRVFDVDGARTVGVTVSDGDQSGDTTETFELSVILNTPPTANDVTGVVDEDGPGINLVADFTDVDVADTHTFGIDTTGTTGTVTNNGDGTFTYDPAGKFETLTADSSVTDLFTYTVNDGNGGESAATVTVTIDGQNDTAAISGIATGETDEDSTATVSGVLSVADVDTGEAAFGATSQTGAYGSFAIDTTGNWSYVLNNSAAQRLNAGELATDSFTVSSIDGTASETVTMTIEGLNDQAAISGNATGQTDEDLLAGVTGSLLVTDVDDGEHQFITLAGTVGNFGVFSIDATGDWTYVLDNSSVQNMSVNEVETDSFTVHSLDGSATETVVITIFGKNDAPQIDSDLDAVSLLEGMTAFNSGTFADVDLSDIVSLTESVGSVVDNGDGTWSWSLETTDSDQSGEVTITATDDQGVAASVSFALNVENVAPEILSITPSAAGVDRSVTLSGLFSDAGTTDSHTIVIDWGEIADSAVNASDDRTIIDVAAEDAKGFSVDHEFGSGGVFTVTVSVIDDDSGDVSDATQIRVSGVRLDPNTSQLQVIGTEQNDYGTITRFGDQIIVAANFLPKSRWWMPFGVQRFSADEVESILVETGEGNDVFAVFDNVAQPSRIDGGTGNDVLTGGGGPSVMFGGDGNDLLFGGSGDDIIRGGTGNDRIFGNAGNDLLLGGEGDDHLDGGRGDDILVGGDGDDDLDGDRGRDLLFGGLGADDLSGGKDDDLLIAGRTYYDDDQMVLETIRDVWNRDQSYQERIAALGTGVETNNGSLVILSDQGEDATVFDDEEEDRLKGQQGSDWFFADLASDRVLGRKRWEQVG